MNNIVLAGRLTREPELKVTNSGTDVMSFTIAVNRAYTKQGESEADFINCVAWQKTAVFINRYFHKGDGIVLNGRLEGRKYVDKDGDNRTAYEVVVERVEFPQGKSMNNAQHSQTASTPVANTNDFQQTPVNDDLPF